MFNKKVSKIELSEVVKRLEGVVNKNYQWPVVPAGWQVEFIAFSNADVALDLLHPVSGRWWSEDNGHFEPPVMMNGQAITATALSKANVPFMTTFGAVKVVEPEAGSSHLSVVATDSSKLANKR